MDIVQIVTDDFVESFKDTTDFSGGYFGLIEASIDTPTFRPVGLNYDDERVKDILNRLRAYRKAHAK